MSKIELIKLKDSSVRLIDGDRGENYPSKKDLLDEGFCLFLDSSNLTKNGFDFTSTMFISKEKDSDLGNGKLEPDDIVINTRGTIGNIGFFKKNIPYRAIRINSGMLILRGGEDYLNNYLFLFLRSPLFYKQIENLMSGSVQSQLPIWILKHLRIPKIPIITQQRIASVLSSLDAKIELNNKINRELEAVAKTLYDYWFVQFNFPDKNGKPYKSSGGKMVWNEQLKREIPEGWSSSNILSIADLKGGGTPSKKKSDYWEGSIPFFTPTDASTSVFILNTNDKITEIGLENCSSTLFNPGTIFITARGSVGKLMITTKAMAMNQSCYALCPQEDISPYYLYFLTKELIHHLQIKASGSVFDSIVTNDIIFTNLVIPIKEMIIFFAKLINPIFMQILNNQQENIILGELRNWLLPMLMNGQVTVQEAEERISMVAEQEVEYGE